MQRIGRWVCRFAGAGEKLPGCAYESNEFGGQTEGKELGRYWLRPREDPETEKQNPSRLGPT